MNKLAVDFDCTLFAASKNWPEAGEHRWTHKLVASYVRLKKRQGWFIVLNTMRERGKGLEKAIKAYKEFNIPIDVYNENYEPDIKKWGESRKIGCTRSIDDTQVGLIGFLLRMFSK